MDEDFDGDLESPIADILQCTPDSKGDHILAARFLNRFVPPKIAWIHLDLAASNRSRRARAYADRFHRVSACAIATHLLLDHGVLSGASVLASKRANWLLANWPERIRAGKPSHERSRAAASVAASRYCALLWPVSSVRAIAAQSPHATTLTITRPDDWHLHVRDGAHLASVVPFTARQFARAVIMPNLKPPVTTVAQARGLSRAHSARRSRRLSHSNR